MNFILSYVIEFYNKNYQSKFGYVFSMTAVVRNDHYRER